MPLHSTFACTRPDGPTRALSPGRIQRAPLSRLAILLVLAGMWICIGACSGSDSEEASDRNPGNGQARAVGPALEGDFRCASPRLDFGLVHEGSVLEAVFDLEVTTDATPSIKGVRADCGCTTAGLQRAPGGDLARLEDYREDTPLDRGDIVRLSVIYDTNGKGGETERKITLYADVPDGRVVLTLEADVRPWLVSEPSRLVLGRMGHRETREESLRIRSVADEPFRLEHDRRAVPDSLTLELTPLDPGPDGRAREWEVQLRLGPDMPEGTHQYPLYLRSDHNLPGLGDQTPFASTTPQVILEVVGLYLAEPTSFHFKQVDGVSSVARTVHLRCFDQPAEGEESWGTPTARVVVPSPETEASDQDPTPATSEALLETARVDVHPHPEGGWNVQLLLEGLAPGVGKTFLALVLVSTGNPDQEVVEIPVLGFRSQGPGQGQGQGQGQTGGNARTGGS